MTKTIKITQDDLNLSNNQITYGKKMAKKIAEHENRKVIKAAAKDEIVFESLLPMDDAPRGQRVLYFFKKCGGCVAGKLDMLTGVIEIDGRNYTTKDAVLGWVPLPTYKPEQ